MKKIKQIVLLTVVSLMFLSPATAVLADSGGTSTSVHSLSYGHDGSAHYTKYSVRYQRATAGVSVSGYGTVSAIAGANGQTANASVTAPANVSYHSHSYGVYE